MKILFIRYKKSKNILEGGEQCSQRNYNTLELLIGKENITTYYIHDESVKKTIFDYLRGLFYFVQNYYFGLSPKRTSEIANISMQYDTVFIDRSVFGIISKKLKENNYKGKVISFFHNLEYDYFNAKMGKYQIGRNIILRCVDKNDMYSCKYSDSIIVLNDRDRKAVYKRYNREADMVIPITFTDKYNRKEYPIEFTRKKVQCLFLGAYFPPNNMGIDWFVKNVYPHVDVEVKIVGKGMNKLRDNYNIPQQIEIFSDVPDLEPYFEDADIMILPIFTGGGMKVKTCESLMYGKNIIGTNEAFEGYILDYNKVGGKCNTPEEFIQKIQDIIENPIPRFNTYSRQIFLENHSEDIVIKLFSQILGF